jgi:hypothetical protein
MDSAISFVRHRRSKSIPDWKKIMTERVKLLSKGPVPWSRSMIHQCFQFPSGFFRSSPIQTGSFLGLGDLVKRKFIYTSFTKSEAVGTPCDVAWLSRYCRERIQPFH